MSGIPPLRITNTDGTFNQIPVFELELSGGVLTKLSPTKVQLAIAGAQGPSGPAGTITIGSGISGAASAGFLLYVSGATLGQIGSGTFQQAITFPLVVGSGGTGLASVISATNLIGFNSSDAAKLDSYRLAASDNLTILRAGTAYFFSATTSDISGKQNSITYPLGINSGGTGLASVISATNLIGFNSSDTVKLDSYRLAASDNMTIVRVGTGYFFSANTGVAGSTVVYAQTGDTFLVYSASTGLTNERVIAASDNITIVSSGTSFLISAITGAGGGASTMVARISMALLSVEVNSSNSFWTAQTDTTRMDKAYINHIDSGRSVSTWWCDVPSNVNATPAWNLEILSEAASLGATGGLVVLNVDGMSAAAGESANTLAASTIQLVAAGSFLMNTAGILTISTMSASDFDGTLATSGTDYMKIKITRVGQSDTFNSDWYVYGVRMKCTVDT